MHLKPPCKLGETCDELITDSNWSQGGIQKFFLHSEPPCKLRETSGVLITNVRWLQGEKKIEFCIYRHPVESGNHIEVISLLIHGVKQTYFAFKTTL